MTSPKVDRINLTPRILVETGFCFGGLWESHEAEGLTAAILHQCIEADSWLSFPRNEARNLLAAGWLPNFVQAGLLELRDGEYHITDLFISELKKHGANSFCTAPPELLAKLHTNPPYRMQPFWFPPTIPAEKTALSRNRDVAASDPRICEMLEVGKDAVAVRIRLAEDRILEFALPRCICPEPACITGGAFILTAKTIDPEEDKKVLDELFSDLNDKPSDTKDEKH